MKHNKTWYNARIAQCTAALENLQELIAAASETCSTPEDNDRLNEMHDTAYLLAEDIRTLEHQRDTRKWGHQDFVQHNLIANNID